MNKFTFILACNLVAALLVLLVMSLHALYQAETATTHTPTNAVVDPEIWVAVDVDNIPTKELYILSEKE